MYQFHVSQCNFSSQQSKIHTQFRWIYQLSHEYSHVRDVKFAVNFEKLCGMENSRKLFLLSNFLFHVPCYSFTPLRLLSVSSYTYPQLLQFLVLGWTRTTDAWVTSQTPNPLDHCCNRQTIQLAPYKPCSDPMLRSL